MGRCITALLCHLACASALAAEPTTAVGQDALQRVAAAGPLCAKRARGARARRTDISGRTHGRGLPNLQGVARVSHWSIGRETVVGHLAARAFCLD